MPNTQIAWDVDESLTTHSGLINSFLNFLNFIKLLRKGTRSEGAAFWTPHIHRKPTDFQDCTYILSN